MKGARRHDFVSPVSSVTRQQKRKGQKRRGTTYITNRCKLLSRVSLFHQAFCLDWANSMVKDCKFSSHEVWPNCQVMERQRERHQCTVLPSSEGICTAQWKHTFPIAGSVKSFREVPMMNWACNLPRESIKPEFLLWIALVNGNTEERLPAQVNAGHIKQDSVSSFSPNWYQISLNNPKSTKTKIPSLLSVVFICGSHLSFPMKLSPSRDKSVGSTEMR